MNKIKLILISLLWLLWTIDAGYLTNEAYKIKNAVKVFGWNWNLWFACDVNATFSCSSVFNEDFAWILGLPFSQIALAIYPIIIVIWILWLMWKIKNPFKILLFIVWWWIIFNWYVIINEFFLGSYCLLCLICTAIIITVWWISLLWLKSKK